MSYPYEFALYAERNRNRVYDVVIEAIEEAAALDGITQSQIAEAMGRKRSQVSAWLSGPSNWTCDTTSDLLRSIEAEMEYRVVFDRDRISSNVQHPALAPPDIGREPKPSVQLQGSGTKRFSIQIPGRPNIPVPAGGTGSKVERKY
jgi:transcriptional regulator with XRE-family HTH domain